MRLKYKTDNKDVGVMLVSDAFIDSDSVLFITAVGDSVANLRCELDTSEKRAEANILIAHLLQYGCYDATKDDCYNEIYKCQPTLLFEYDIDDGQSID